MTLSSSRYHCFSATSFLLSTKKYYDSLGCPPLTFPQAMPTNTADKSDFPEDDYPTRGPLVETENLLAQEHVPLQKRRSFNRTHSLSWAAQLLFFLISLAMLHRALFLKKTGPTNCVEKHSLFCKPTGKEA